MVDLNLRSCCSASARPSVMTCAIFPSSSVAATSNSNAKPVLPDGFCFQIRFSTKEVVTSLDEPTGQNRWSASAESWFSYLHTIFFMNLTAFFGISDCFASIWFLSQSPKLIMVIMSWFKVHLETCFTTQNTLNFGCWKVPVTFFHGNGLLKTAPDPWRNNPQITLSHNSSKCWKMNSPDAWVILRPWVKS